jgi:hypothetical protein
MRRELELARRLHTLEVLGEAVGAMKTLSAHHYREVRGAVEPARAYREGIERIVGWAGAHLGAGEGGAGLIIIGAELGLCGGYNARVVEVAPSAVPSSVRGPPSASGTVPPRFSGAWTLGSRGRIRDPRALEDSRACSSSSGKKCCPPTSRGGSPASTSCRAPSWG